MGSGLCGPPREAGLTRRGPHCSCLVMEDEIDITQLPRDAMRPGGFVEEAGLELGLKAEVQVRRK